MIHYSAGSPDDDLDTSLERPVLCFVALPAVDRHGTKTVDAAGVFFKRPRNLDRQLTSRSQHQHLWLFLLRIQLRKNRPSKRCRFSRASFGLPHQVTSRQNVFDRLSLDRRWFRVASFLNRSQNFGA